MAIGYVMLYTNSNILCSICTKLHMFDKCAGLNTSTCQYPVIVIAPPAGSRKFGRYKWLWHIPPVFITWNAYCSLFIDFLKPDLAVRPGCEGPFIAACSFNYYYYYYFPNLIAFLRALNMLEKSRNFAHAPEVAKIYIWYGFSKVGVAKWLDSATYTLSTCAPRATFHVHVWKSVHSCNTPIPTKKSLGAKSQTQQEVCYF